jgi:hypothetical protein
MKRYPNGIAGDFFFIYEARTGDTSAVFTAPIVQ